MRELKYYVACTVDRFIARRDGSYDAFLAEGEHFADLIARFPETFPAFTHEALGIKGENRCFDTVLMGRTTYEVGTNVGVMNPYPQMRQYLFSRTLRESPDPAVTLVSDDAVSAVRELKRQPGKDIWLCGGAELAATLFSEIDEIILKVNPVLIGDGIPLFARAVDTTALELVEHTAYSNGFMLVRYRLNHSRES